MKKQLLFFMAIFFVFTSCAKDKKDVIITIHTSYGDMKVILYEETPLHKANFIKLAEKSLYDSTIFHRVIKEFMIQGGNVNEKMGTTSSETIPAEFVKTFYHHKGALSAARQGERTNPKKASSWCQFYVVHGKKFDKAELTVDRGRLSQAMSQLMRYDSHADIKDKFMALQEKNDFEAMNLLCIGLCRPCRKRIKYQIEKRYIRRSFEDIYRAGRGTSS